MKTPEQLRSQFEKEYDNPWRLQGVINSDYVYFLEGKLTDKTKPNPLTKPIIDLYFKWYEELTGLEPDFSKGEGNAAKKIAGYMTRLVKKKCPNPTEKQVIDGFAFVLNNYKKWDKFYQGQLKISQISSNITNIIANIKGVTPSNGTKQQDRTNQKRRFIEGR
jgi:hypothetical protein